MVHARIVGRNAPGRKPGPALPAVAASGTTTPDPSRPATARRSPPPNRPPHRPPPESPMKRLPLLVLLILPLALTGCFIVPQKDATELQPVPGPPAAQPRTAPTVMDLPAMDAMAPAPGTTPGTTPGASGAATDADAAAMTDASVDAPPPPPAPQAAPEPAPQLIRTYTVERGDSFWKIAKKVYGDGMRMKDIEAANPGVDPMRIRIGDEIVLPE